MALFLAPVVIAIVLGLIGAVADGLGYFLGIGIAVLVIALVYLAVRWRRSSRHPARRPHQPRTATGCAPGHGRWRCRGKGANTAAR